MLGCSRDAPHILLPILLSHHFLAPYFWDHCVCQQVVTSATTGGKVGFLKNNDSRNFDGSKKRTQLHPPQAARASVCTVQSQLCRERMELYREQQLACALCWLLPGGWLHKGHSNKPRIKQMQDQGRSLGVGWGHLKARLTEAVQNSSCRKSQQQAGCLSSKFTEEASDEVSP